MGTILTLFACTSGGKVTLASRRETQVGITLQWPCKEDMSS